MEHTGSNTQILGAYYAKTHFSTLLDGLEKGLDYLITRNDKPVGRFIPYQENDLEEKKRRAFLAGERIRAARFSLGSDLNIKDLINEGRKYVD